MAVLGQCWCARPVLDGHRGGQVSRTNDSSAGKSDGEVLGHQETCQLVKLKVIQKMDMNLMQPFFPGEKS